MSKPKGFTCAECRKEHTFSMYVYAHSSESLLHTCDCGAKVRIRNFVAVPVKEKKKS